jgi:HSP20 family protein
MTIVHYDPLHDYRRLQKEINRLFENQPPAGESSGATADWIPAVDIDEYADRFVLRTDLPGVEPGNIEVSVENDTLTLRGERPRPAADETVKHRKQEAMYGHFYRRFTLPDTIDADNVRATGSNGVLEIHIPKHPQPQRRRINVET